MDLIIYTYMRPIPTAYKYPNISTQHATLLYRYSFTMLNNYLLPY